MSLDAVGRALAAACPDRAVLGRIGGALGEAARAALGHDRQRRVEAIAAVRAPVPPGLRGVEPSWIEAGLAGLPARARVALGQGPRDATDVWLVRAACAGIPPLPVLEPALVRPRVPADVARMTGAALRAWLEEIARDQLAFALGDHAARVPGLAPAIARIALPPRAGELGPRRAAVARARGEPLAIGARAVAPHLDPLVARSLVLRLPHPEGVPIFAELTAHRAGQTASWAALVAP